MSLLFLILGVIFGLWALMNIGSLVLRQAVNPKATTGFTAIIAALATVFIYLGVVVF